MSRQGGLFEDDYATPVRYGREWQHANSLSSCCYPADTDSHGYYFERNVWQLLERSPFWENVQESELEAALWLVAIAQEYNEFTNYAIDETDEFNVLGVLHNEFHVDEDDLAQHLLEYGNDDVEVFGFPSFDTVSPHDALLDRLVTLRGRIRSLIKETVGAPELRLNFYRDPSGWDSRLRGVALPRLESQEPLKLTNDWNEVMRFVEQGKKVPPLPPLPEWFDKGWSSILVRGHDKQFATNAWHPLRRSKLAPKLSGPHEEAALWAVMLRLSYVGFLEVAMDE